MKKVFIFIVLNCTMIVTLKADNISELALKYGLYPGNKATIQWERVFSSQRRLEKYNLDTLSPQLKQKLKQYLIEHAADSDQPIVPGL